MACRSEGPWSVSLTTGLDENGKVVFISTQEAWQKALASGEFQKFLKNMNLIVSKDHGFMPERDGIAAVGLEKRIMSSLPHIMVSRPRQSSDLAESMLSRCDAAPRSYWLRDWQEGFSGFTKGV